MEEAQETTPRQRPGPGQEPEQQPTSSIRQSVPTSAIRRGPSRLLVGWQPQGPPSPLTPREEEQQRLALEQFKARKMLEGGSLLGENLDDKDSSESDEEDGSTSGEQEEDSDDPIVMSKGTSTLERFGSFIYRFGGFGGFGQGGSSS